MSGLNRRLCRLEANSSSECPECGLSPDELVEHYEVLWYDHEDDEPVEPEWCETCGEQVVYVVGWADIKPVGLGEGGSYGPLCPP